MCLNKITGLKLKTIYECNTYVLYFVMKYIYWPVRFFFCTRNDEVSYNKQVIANLRDHCVIRIFSQVIMAAESNCALKIVVYKVYCARKHTDNIEKSIGVNYSYIL